MDVHLDNKMGNCNKKWILRAKSCLVFLSRKDKIFSVTVYFAEGKAGRNAFPYL